MYVCVCAFVYVYVCVFTTGHESLYSGDSDDTYVKSGNSYICICRHIFIYAHVYTTWLSHLSEMDLLKHTHTHTHNKRSSLHAVIHSKHKMIFFFFKSRSTWLNSKQRIQSLAPSLNRIIIFKFNTAKAHRNESCIHQAKIDYKTFVSTYTITLGCPAECNYSGNLSLQNLLTWILSLEHVYGHTHTHAYTYTHTHIHTHTYTRS